MTLIMQYGLELIRAVQRIRNPVLDAFFIGVTALGSEDFYFVILPFLLWCVDFAVGARVAAIFLLSTYVNIGLKDLFRLPRPFELDSSVQVYEAEGYGLPSGHAQLSVVIWGAIAHAYRTAWAWAGAVILAALIGFSRIYLGVHFPSDVVIGWLIGAVLVVSYVLLHARVEAWLEEKGFTMQIVVAVGLSLALVLLHTTENTTSLVGVLVGAAVGISILRKFFDYDPGGPIWKRAVRFFIGVAVLLALRFGLKTISPSEPRTLQLASRFVRYALLGLWIGLGAPWLFSKLRLNTNS